MFPHISTLISTLKKTKYSQKILIVSVLKLNLSED